MRTAVVLDDLAELFLDAVDVTLTFCLHQNLDPRLVLVVAASVLVVDAHHRFDVIHDVLPRQKLTQHGADHGRAAHAAAHRDAKSQFARLVA